MAKETEKEAFITLDFSGTEKKFADINELREFMQYEESAWFWLEQAAQENANLDEVWQTFRRYFMRVAQFIGQYEMHLGQRELPTNLINYFRGQTETAVEQGFILAEAPSALFAFGLKDSESPKVAGYALASLSNIKIKMDANDQTALQGMFWAKQYLQSLEPDSDEASKKIDGLVELARANRLEKQYKELRKKNEQLIKTATELQGQSSLLIKRAEQQAIERAKKFTDLFHSTNKELAGLKNSYQERIKLKSSINYWNAKRYYHQLVMLLMAASTLTIALSTASIFTVMSISLFATTPKAEMFTKIVFSKIASIAPDSSKRLFDLITTDTTTFGATATGATATGTTATDTTATDTTATGADKTGTITPGTKKPDKPILTSDNIWKFSIMLLISTIGIWLTRLSTKIFISNLHLGTETYERVTMIKTYFSLLAEDKGLKDDDRELILQTLFRPSTTGFIKDDGPSNIPEVLAKAVTRR